ncbi:MAG: hypothetical protein LC624_05870, partial [Halobacteriales archaeon]|nr:hypothetical protein [Halobacteriales archaeon]
MRTISILAMCLLLLPAAAATVTNEGQVQHNTTVISPLPAVNSNPLAQNADTYNVVLGPGMTVVADLTYADTSGNALGNDLDLALGPPSVPPTPLLPCDGAGQPACADPAGTAANLVPWAQLTATATVARAQCQNVAAQSHTHGVQPGAEHIDYTVPAGGESGIYRLTVTGFLLFQDQPYALT